MVHGPYSASVTNESLLVNTLFLVLSFSLNLFFTQRGYYRNILLTISKKFQKLINCSFINFKFVYLSCKPVIFSCYNRDISIYTFIGIHNHPKKLFFIICPTKKKRNERKHNEEQRHFREKSVLKV